MARDYTKYQVDGIDGVFGKGKLVLTIVQDYCSKNECTFDELKEVFPDEAQGGSTGVFGTLEEAEEIAKKRARHYVKAPITLKDATIAVSNQWGDNLPLFIEKAEAVGYKISTENSANSGEPESEKESNSDKSNKDDESQLVEFDGSTFCQYHHFSLLQLDDELDFFNSIEAVFCVFENEEEEFLVNTGDNDVYVYVEYIDDAIEIGAKYLAEKSFLNEEVLSSLLYASYEQEDGSVFENNGRVILGIEVFDGDGLDEEVFEGMQGILYQKCPDIDIKIESDCFNVDGEIAEDNDIMGYSDYIEPPTVALYIED